MTLEAAAVLSESGPISKRLPGFEVRGEQLEMATAVDACLERRGRLIVEAGTGVGKSFAYLVPAIRQVVEKGQRVIISTHTIALQEQLVEKDVPLLRAATSAEFSTVLVKGRGNYVSLRRLELALTRGAKLFPDESHDQQLEQLDAWARSTDDGSTSSLAIQPERRIWDLVQSDAGNCMGRKCPRYDACHYQKARRRMEGGQILVTNHALFFSDLAMRANGGRGFLPAYGHVILDEAHSIEEVAAEHFGGQISESAVAHLLRSLWNPATHRGALSDIRLKDGGDAAVRSVLASVEDCRKGANAFFSSLRRWRANQPGEGELRIREPGIVEDSLSPSLSQLATLLNLTRERAAEESDGWEVNALAQQAEAFAQATRTLLAQSIPGCAFWLELSAARPSRKQDGFVTLAAAAIEVGPLLQKHLLSQEVSVVMTSGTLATTRGDLTAAVRTLGAEGAATLVLGSPFDYARQARCIIETDLPDPREAMDWEPMAQRILRHIEATDGGAFVLCTSFRDLNELRDALAEPLDERGYPTLWQGAGVSAGTLLKRFREDERSVLFGVASFWQGVDVRGRGLRNVIVTRLPFEPPDAPLTQARHDLIEARGGNPFRDDSLPRAIVRFRQGFGRLIRSGTDTGQFVILDSRVVQKRYGRAFLDALPEGLRIESLDD